MNDINSMAERIPAKVLSEHHVSVVSDDRYRAALRFMAALWREEEKIPIGQFVARDGSLNKLGSLISGRAARSGRNFMTPAIAELANTELTYRQFGALYDPVRMRGNLLSSQAICFNLFGLAKIDPEFAQRFMAALMPCHFAEVTGVYFEFSPGRGVSHYTADFTAFDLLITGNSPSGERTFVAVELKYAEAATDRLPRRFSPRHEEIARQSGVVADPENPELYRNPHQQLFREHMLAQSMIQQDEFDAGQFIVVAPAANEPLFAACKRYESLLGDPQPKAVGFEHINLERVIRAVSEAGESAYADRLFRRYCDFERIGTQATSAAA